jgi:hypothetical protein
MCEGGKRGCRGGDATWLLLLLARALPSCDAQSSCPAGTANLDSDGVCHQCWDYVPPHRSGHGQRDISNTLANNAAGCVRTVCFSGARTDSLVITTETIVTNYMVAGCSSEYGCYASCPGIEMPRPAYTQSRTQCPLPPVVSGGTITLNGGLEQGQHAAYTCQPGLPTPRGVNAPADISPLLAGGDATRTCQAAVAPAVGYSWSGTGPTCCSEEHPCVDGLQSWDSATTGGGQYTYCGGRDCNLFRLYKLPAIGTALLDVGPTSSQCSDCTTNQQCTNRDGCGPAMYAALCAERGLRPIGCRCDAANCEGDSTNIGSGAYYWCNRYDCLHMPNSWGCNIDVSARTNLGTGLMFFQHDASLHGSSGAGSFPVCGSINL